MTKNTLKTLKKRKCVLCTRKMVGKKKVTTDLLVFFQMFQKFTKGVCIIRSIIFLKTNFSMSMRNSQGFQCPKCNSFHGRKDARDKKEVCEAILTDCQTLLTVSVMICS